MRTDSPGTAVQIYGQSAAGYPSASPHLLQHIIYRFMKKILLSGILLLFSALTALADGGMWMLTQLAQKYAAMAQSGLQLAQEEIYNPNGTSLKDAVVMFDGGCTGVIVSEKGLVLTNHHCGYNQIQSHSSVEHNYLQDGFSSQSFKEELVCPGLEVELVDRIEDVTDKINALLQQDGLAGTLQALSPAVLSAYAAQIVGPKEAAREGYKYIIKPFYGGNKYYMFVHKVYSDVRLVAAPPSSIGKFGADTDNWEWPRHAGDFSVFRIYADRKGNPVPYSAKNVPLKPKRFVQVSTGGVKENDFALIMGFPGTTYHFYTPYEVDSWAELDNNIRIEMRGIRQEIMLRHMLSNEAVNIQYAAKYASSQNGYKRAQGANWAIKHRNLRASKEAQMNALLGRVEGTDLAPEMTQAVGNIETLTRERYPLHRHKMYLEESFFYGMEFPWLPVPTRSSLSTTPGTKEQWEESKQLLKRYNEFYNKDYSPVVDRDISAALAARYCQRIDRSLWPAELQKGVDKFGSAAKYVEYLFANSLYVQPDKFKETVEKGDFKALASDPMLLLALDIWSTYQAVTDALQAYNPAIASAQKSYIKGVMNTTPADELWPDANLTLRFTYGRVQGYAPRDNVRYGHQTTLEGVMEKEDSTSWEFNVSPKLKQIYQEKNFGPYANPDGSMPVDFCATTHTTGGNSGSPVMNARGELIGLNFDRNWEGVGGDIEYLPNYQRSIILDIRYLLLVVDKYLECPRLLKEMNL